MDLNLNGRRALVCGSTQGIGKAIAIELASLGAQVVLLARNQDVLATVKSELPGDGHEYLVADFGKPAELREVITTYFESNSVDILVNNTGGPPGGQAIDADLEEFRLAFNSHLVCNQILAQAVVPGMKKNGYGRIVNVISTSVKMPIKGLGVSNTIRGAVASWSKTLALELGPFGITVNNVLPGATKTARLESIFSTRASKQGVDVRDVEDDFLAEIPAGRFAEASEIAAAAAFLASPAASYINGINVPVDGGRTGSL